MSTHSARDVHKVSLLLLNLRAETLYIVNDIMMLDSFVHVKGVKKITKMKNMISVS